MGDDCSVCYRVSFGGDENVLELDSGDGCTTLKKKEKKHYTLKSLVLYILSE